MRNKFEEQLEQLNVELIEMGSLCEEVIYNASKALIDGDTVLAKNIFPKSGEIKQKERMIENLCLKLLLMQQPVARDLRQISSALKMITDMERIGDQAADIAEIIDLANIKASDNTGHINQMANATIKMVTESIDAYVKEDLQLAKAVIEYDDIVDDLFNEIKSDLISTLSTGRANGEYAVDLLMIAKYFERIGDHAVNIAEWVAFSITGKHKGENDL